MFSGLAGCLWPLGRRNVFRCPCCDPQICVKQQLANLSAACHQPVHLHFTHSWLHPEQRLHYCNLSSISTVQALTCSLWVKLGKMGVEFHQRFVPHPNCVIHVFIYIYIYIYLCVFFKGRNERHLGFIF